MATGTINNYAQNTRLGDSNNIISNFDDATLFKSKFISNGIVVLPFATAAQNQPVTATWGFCIVYYAAANTVFEILYVNSRGDMCLRNYSGSFGNWVKIAKQT